MGYFLHGGFDVTTYAFSDKRIKKDITAAVISDLHECFHGKNNSILMLAIKKADPDIIIIAGDLIDGVKGGDCTGIMHFLKSLARRYPVYYAYGNHEKRTEEYKYLAAQRARFKRGLKEAGVKPLKNRSVDLEGTGIRITGLDLPLKYYPKVVSNPLPTCLLYKYLGDPDRNKYNVLIAHNPEHFKSYCSWHADIILSGHVHGGIVGLGKQRGLISTKFTLFPEYVKGLYRSGRTNMIVSRGLGNHSINFRLNNRTELVILKLCRESV
ncbi:MAG: metallophosphoesterase [Lachnospiraceae bacterium]|nr:metallophosphoesterase [Lachnospiraceae bacterium]